ncbi:MAG: VanW family protein [Armatimonadetes bacterium]|nr:VanW family protein [Armatimonadota bacterium]
MVESDDVTRHTDTLEPVTAAAPALSGAGRVLLIVAASIVAVILLATVALVALDYMFQGNGRIARNVSIQGVPVQGMTAEQALAAVNTHWAATLPGEITITYPVGSTEPPGEWRIPAEELGVTLKVEEAVQEALKIGREGGVGAHLMTRLRLLRTPVDVPVHRHVDERILAAVMPRLAEVVDREPKDADITVEGEKVEVIPGLMGRKLDIEATVTRLAGELEDPEKNTVAAVVETTAPNVTAEDLADIEVVLGEYTTKFRPWQRDRTHNLKLAAAALNETVIKPGETLSLNERIGERLTERGYRPAPIFLEGEVRPSTGGGVCQIATTTYNAALLANLDVVERHHHSRPVNYAPTGRDATVYWGQYDLKIKNNLTHPVLLLTSMGENTLTMKFLGSREDDYDVEITREGLSRVGYGTKEVPDPELEEGKREIEKHGRSGWRVTVYRKVTRNGEVVREEKLHSDYYAPQTEIVRVGTKKAEEPEATETGAEAGTATTTTPSAPPTIAPATGAAEGDDASG